MSEKATATISSFGISEALGAGWDFFQKNIGTLIPVGLVYAAAAFLPSILLGGYMRDEESPAVLIRIILNIWNIYLSLGITRYMLSLLRGGKPELSSIFKNNSGFMNYFLMNIRVFLVIIGGFVLLIIPGIYFALKYAFTLMLVADGKADGGEAFRLSGEMTKGRELTLFAYGLVTLLMVLIGAIFFVIPGIIAGAVSGIGMYFLYEYALQKREKAEA